MRFWAGLGAAAMAAAALVACDSGGDDKTTVSTSTSAPPSPSLAIEDASRAFRETAASLMEDAVGSADAQPRTDDLVAVSVGGGPSVLIAAPFAGTEALTQQQLANGAQVLALFLPPTVGPDLVPDAYAVRVRRERGAWRAALVRQGGEVAGETAATVGASGGTGTADGCRPAVQRADRKFTVALDCPGYRLQLSLGESAASSGEVAPTTFGRRIASANDGLRRSVRSAVCREVRRWEPPTCPTGYLLGSRSDSLVIGGVVEDRAMFTFLDLPDADGIATGFYLLRTPENAAGTANSTAPAQLLNRTGTVVDEPTTTITRRAAASDAGTDEAQRYVSYHDSSTVCLDHDYQVVDTTSGTSYTETAITCFSRLASSTTLGSPTTSSTVAGRATTTRPSSTTTRPRTTTSTVPATTTTQATTTTTEATTTTTTVASSTTATSVV